VNRGLAVNAAIGLGIFLVNAALNGPLFMPGEMPFRGSIEGGYVGMARFVAANPHPWGWNPLQYGGLPTQSMYLPALPYLTAGVVWVLPGASPDHVYRVLTAVLACLGPVSLFFFVLYFTRSRGWALAAALAYTFFSPLYGLVRTIDRDRGIVQLPWRIQVLAKYGEGPHNAGLTLLPPALMAVWVAGVGRRYWHILAAAVLLAAICLTNWVAALALAICSGLMMMAAFCAGKSEFRVRRALAAAGLAYLLACFWLTPSFIRTTVFNWPADAFDYKLLDAQRWLMAGLAVGILAIWGLFRRRRAGPYLCFVTMGAFAFGWITMSYYGLGADVLPESRRYALEFELFLVLALAEWMRQALGSRDAVVRFCAIGPAALLLVSGAGQARAYATQGWEAWRPVPREETVEHRIASWVAERRPAGRVLASGGLRFRLNAWHDIPQVGGVFESGLRNRIPYEMTIPVRTAKYLAPGTERPVTMLLLKSMGVQYVVAHGPKSREYYRDFTNIASLDGLPVVFETEDDRVYELPFASPAHLVGPEEVMAPGRPPAMELYVRAIEDAARPRLKVEWSGARALAVEGPVPEGMLVSLQVNEDPGWTAVQDGRPIAIASDGMGFMLLRPAPAAQARIELRYEGTGEQRAMAAVSALAWLGAIGAVLRRRREGRPRDLAATA
jgi:hypothetical protein